MSGVRVRSLDAAEAFDEEWTGGVGRLGVAVGKADGEDDVGKGRQ